LASAVTLVLPSTASADQLSATPSTLGSVFASARGGDTIQLAAGDYGTFRGAQKSGVVTLVAQSGAAVTMDLDFDPASNITIDGVKITDATLADSRTKNIIVRNSDIPGQVTFRTDELANANILFERNVHRDWDKCGDCAEGRVSLPAGSSQPTGITIRNSEFKGGLSDGIQTGSNGTQIINNTFHDFEPGSSDGVHADAIQLYGSENTVIRGNYFYDLNVPMLMAADGADHELIEDNVVHGDSDGYPFVTLFSDDGSIVRHNTFADGPCAFNLRCGILRIGAKSGDPEGRGTVVEDNILGDIAVEAGNLARRSHNLLADRGTSGASEIFGMPTYVGGANPATYAGHRLAPGSLGKGNASDGLDRGARIDGAGPPPPDPSVDVPDPPPPDPSVDPPGPGLPAEPPTTNDVTACRKAKAEVVSARNRLEDAVGHRQTRKAQRTLRKARRRMRNACRG
jgi:hypothetical protein